MNKLGNKLGIEQDFWFCFISLQDIKRLLEGGGSVGNIFSPGSGGLKIPKGMRYGPKSNIASQHISGV